MDIAYIVFPRITASNTFVPIIILCSNLFQHIIYLTIFVFVLIEISGRALGSLSNCSVRWFCYLVHIRTYENMKVLNVILMYSFLYEP